jgi:hypothetical protein
MRVSKEWLKSEVQSLAKVYNGALNEEPSILKRMNTRSKRVFEFLDQCNPSLKSPRL